MRLISIEVLPKVIMAFCGLTDNGWPVLQSILFHKMTVRQTEIVVQQILTPSMTPQSLSAKTATVRLRRSLPSTNFTGFRMSFGSRARFQQNCLRVAPGASAHCPRFLLASPKGGEGRGRHEVLRLKSPLHEPDIGRDIALRCPRPRSSGRNYCAAERGADGAARRPYPVQGFKARNFVFGEISPQPSPHSGGERETGQCQDAPVAPPGVFGG
jgi:hypothetical protein